MDNTEASSLLVQEVQILREKSYQANLVALVVPETAGKRLICVSGGIFLPEIAQILSEEFGPRGYRVPTGELPNWFVRLYGPFDPLVRENSKGLGSNPQFANRQIKEILDWKPVPLKKTILDMGESLIEYGVV